MPPIAANLQEPILFRTELRPYRSATPRQIRTVALLVVGVWTAVGLVFVLIGAWPVFGFMGAEVVLLYGALRLNLQMGRAVETIHLTERALIVNRVNHWGQRSTWSLPPYWLQVVFDDPPTGHSRLQLRTQGRALTVGAFLPPGERVKLANTLRRELRQISVYR